MERPRSLLSQNDKPSMGSGGLKGRAGLSAALLEFLATSAVTRVVSTDPRLCPLNRLVSLHFAFPEEPPTIPFAKCGDLTVLDLFLTFLDPIVCFEFDGALTLPFFATIRREDLQSEPFGTLRPFLQILFVDPGSLRRVEGMEEETDLSDGKCRISTPHHLFGSVRPTSASVERLAT